MIVLQTTLLHSLRSHGEIEMNDREVCFGGGGISRAEQSLERVNNELAKLHPKSSSKVGIKCPAVLREISSIERLASHSSETKLVIGLRHPIRFIESFYNYRITELYEKGIQRASVPPLEGLIGESEDWKGVHLSFARFENTLKQLGKTRALLNREGIPVATNRFKVFLYSIEQLDESNSSFREDMQNYLELDTPIAAFGSENLNHNAKEGLTGTIDICSERYDRIRQHLLSAAGETSRWIREQFLSSSDVQAGDEPRFVELLQSWDLDPCAVVPKSENAGKPKAIVHVGPRKTGTSAIQRIMKRNENHLQDDGFELPVKKNNQFPPCNIYFANRTSDNPCLNDNEEYISYKLFKSQKENILISSEGLDNINKIDWERFDSVFAPWDTEVVLVHRRFFKWMVSLYGQQMRRFWNFWPPPLHEIEALSKEERFMLENPSHFDKRRNNKKFLTTEMIQLWRSVHSSRVVHDEFISHSYKVRVLNYEAHDDIAESFFCEQNWSTNKTCSAIRQSKQDAGTDRISHNEGQETSYDEIAFAAYSAGMFDGNSISRPEARKRIQTFHEQVNGLTVKDLPRDCVADGILDQLLELSIDDEIYFFGHNEEGLRSLQDEFDEYKSTKLCAVDTEIVLTDAMWMSFLSNF